MAWFKSVDSELINSANGFSVRILHELSYELLCQVVAGPDNGIYTILGSGMEPFEASLFIENYTDQLKKAGEIVLEPK